MEKIKLEINSQEQIDKYAVRRAERGWGRGNLDKALEVYEKWGLDAFRKCLPESSWKIKKDILEVFRAIKKEELEVGPILYAGRDPDKKIQRLTSWTKDKEFAEEWAGENGVVLKMIADQNDIAFFPVSSPHKNKEQEVVIADYHLKKDKILLENKNTD